MKSAAASSQGLYCAYDHDADSDDEPTRVGYRAEEVREAALLEDLPPSAPLTPRVTPSFFPPDDTSHVITPTTISGEYAAVRVKGVMQPRALDSVPPIDKTFVIRETPKRLGNDGAFGFGWMLGLAFLSACTVFVWLWFVARWLVH